MTTRMNDTFLIDRQTLDSTRVTADGFLVATPRVARTGIQLYYGAELGLSDKRSQVFKVYRPENEVFRRDSMNSFAYKPVTDDHPPAPVTADNWKEYARGSLGSEVVRDGEFVRVPMTLLDSASIKKFRGGKAELSVGYTCDIEWGEGRAPDGATYDAMQTNIHVNHVAVVDSARGGSSLRIGDSASELERAAALAAQVKRVEAFDAKMRNSPGFVEVTDEERAATAKVLANRDARLSNAWKHPAPTVDAAPPAKTDTTQANDAEAAYEARRHRLENAWRGGR